MAFSVFQPTIFWIGGIAGLLTILGFLHQSVKRIRRTILFPDVVPDGIKKVHLEDLDFVDILHFHVFKNFLMHLKSGTVTSHHLANMRAVIDKEGARTRGFALAAVGYHHYKTNSLEKAVCRVHEAYESWSNDIIILSVFVVVTHHYYLQAQL